MTRPANPITRTRRLLLTILEENCEPEALRAYGPRGGCLVERFVRKLRKNAPELIPLMKLNDAFVASGSLPDFDALVQAVRRMR